MHEEIYTAISKNGWGYAANEGTLEDRASGLFPDRRYFYATVIREPVSMFYSECVSNFFVLLLSLLLVSNLSTPVENLILQSMGTDFLNKNMLYHQSQRFVFELNEVLL
jgi:hypothetical protein